MEKIRVSVNQYPNKEMELKMSLGKKELQKLAKAIDMASELEIDDYISVNIGGIIVRITHDYSNYRKGDIN
jgi:hypothetical protein